MVWQDVFPVSVSRRDAEEERELRLAAQARAGADWAFAALVARYQPPVTRYLTRLTGNPAQARGLAERIFVRMERRIRGPQGGLHLRLWMLRACTETGLDAVRQPRHSHSGVRLEGPRPTALLTGQAATAATDRLRAGWGALASLTGTTSRQMRKLIWSAPGAAGAAETTDADELASQPLRQAQAEAAQTVEEVERMDPREALRYRMVRAVLAELPYGDAQCLALHLVAGLNQAEVAQALGITHSATRKRIVHGLQLFAQRYEAAAVSLGLPAEALAPTSDFTPEPAATLNGSSHEDDEEMFDIADQPTLDLKRPTIVTGTLAAVSPVIRAAGPDEHGAAVAGASARDETGPAEKEPEAPAEPAHVYPAVAEVVALPAAEISAGESDKPFVVALAAEAVELVVHPEESGEMPPAAGTTLPAPEFIVPLAVRLVPILTEVERVDANAADREHAAHAQAPTSSAARVVPVLTAVTEAANEPGAEAAESPTATEREDAAPLEPPVPAAATTAVRLVPVVTPGTDVAEAANVPGAARRIPLDEDSIATRPLRGRNGMAYDHGAKNGGHGAGTEGGASLAAAMVAADDAGADI